MVCFLIKVFGQVQGVFFRHSAKNEAEKSALVGYIKNLDDGSVEIVICGERGKINQFIKWCRKGPLLAQVEKIEVKEIEFQKFYDFKII